MNSLSNLEGVSTGPMTWTMFGRAFHVVSCLLYQLKESKMFDHVVKLPPPPLPRMFVGLFSLSFLLFFYSLFKVNHGYIYFLTMNTTRRC